MCQHCPGEDQWSVHPSLNHPTMLHRRRFLQLAAAGTAAAFAVGADAGLAEAGAKIKIPKITPRSVWGADESLRASKVYGWAPFRKIVVHHTASPNSIKNVYQTMQTGYRLHTVDRGFSDIGYHFLISPDGEIFEGRYARKYAKGEPHLGEDGAGNGVVGGHSLGKNAGSIGICLIGNFMDRKPSTAALESLAHLVSFEAQRHKIDPLLQDTYVDLQGKASDFYNIVGHRGIRQTQCPGNKMAELMPWLRQEVANRAGRYPARKSDMRKLAWIL
jgi:hypothetical protein